MNRSSYGVFVKDGKPLNPALDYLLVSGLVIFVMGGMLWALGGE
jgi:hypothetical protein